MPASPVDGGVNTETGNVLLVVDDGDGSAVGALAQLLMTRHPAHTTRAVRTERVWHGAACRQPRRGVDSEGRNSEGAAGGGPGEGSRVAGVEGLEGGLGAVADAVAAEFEVEVRGTTAPGVAGQGDLLTGGDGVTEADVEGAGVAVGVA